MKTQKENLEIENTNEENIENTENTDVAEATPSDGINEIKESDDIYAVKKSGKSNGLIARMLDAIQKTDKKSIYVIRPTYGSASGLAYQISLKIKEQNLPYASGVRRQIYVKENGEMKEYKNVVVLFKE
jgi:hypothetical protein